MIRLRAATLAAGLALLPGWAAALDVRIEGIEGDVAANIRHYLDDLDPEQFSRTRVEGETQRRAREAMRVYGYYEPDIQLRLDDRDPPRHVELVIEPGPRVTIERIDFTLAGDSREDPPFQEAIDAFPLAQGDPLVHAPYDRLRSRLANLALERGYFDWRFTDRRMEVRPFAESARLYLALDSGPRYRFGDVSIRGSHIETDRLRNMLTFAPGDPYLAGELARYNQRLGQSGWFGSITVRPRLIEGEALLQEAEAEGFLAELDAGAVEEAGPRLEMAAVDAASAVVRRGPPEVPIDIALTPADRHQFEVGVGYATDVGPRLRFSWEQPWINRYGHGLDHDLFLSAPEQRFSGVYSMPLEDPLRDSYRFQYGLRHRDNKDTRSLEATVEAARRWEFENRWVQTLYVRSTYEDFTQGGDAEQVLILYPGISWSRTRTRNPTFPDWGDRQRIAFEVSDGLWGSDADFLRMTGETQWIRMFGDDTRLVTGVGIGAIETDDFGKVPPSLRFFAGGDRSVRGYGYESLSPRNEEGRLTGGQQLLTASVELQRRLTGSWWGAAFVDTGDAFDDWGPDDLNTGAGLGVRWISPVGPIRFDIAHPFDDEDNAWRLHFAIGPEF
ncbi:autotransporter assembly complex protein TamA [Halomonas mongoliensis]|jgi:translocation and assembly module TamA|uniref:Translocation and assembly module subunit TamA n=1 Tax=Halomonas mongoliensis TaxID=321265 RepID=A0ABU1GM49_9GAMM|nr:autotransporter assembly complex family protein [Halomonas mongoliensis]MDR5892587.1 autotransporter assembly complex protein TamA [Halomonas mongoliensis]